MYNWGVKPKVIAVVGPTASGKTSLGIFLASKLGGEVVSADSRQVYTGLDIGTGKVTKREAKGIPHHLIDVASPRRQFSVDDFTAKGTKAVSYILRKNRVPVIVGGTGLYLDALVGRIVVPNVPPNSKLRALLDTKTPTQLYAQLELRDPERARTIEPHHKRRLIRALEIAAALGRSPRLAEVLRDPKYDVLWLGLKPSDAKLTENIRKRLKARLRAGMVAEAKRLHKVGVSYKRMEELGLEYRYLAMFLQKRLTKAEFEAGLERAIQKYAKRQMTWFKRNGDIRWVKSSSEALRLAKVFLNDAQGEQRD